MWITFTLIKYRPMDVNLTNPLMAMVHGNPKVWEVKENSG